MNQVVSAEYDTSGDQSSLKYTITDDDGLKPLHVRYGDLSERHSTLGIFPTSHLFVYSKSAYDHPDERVLASIDSNLQLGNTGIHLMIYPDNLFDTANSLRRYIDSNPQNQLASDPVSFISLNIGDPHDGSIDRLLQSQAISRIKGKGPCSKATNRIPSVLIVDPSEISKTHDLFKPDNCGSLLSLYSQVVDSATSEALFLMLPEYPHEMDAQRTIASLRQSADSQSGHSMPTIVFAGRDVFEAACADLSGGAAWDDVLQRARRSKGTITCEGSDDTVVNFATGGEHVH